MRVYFTYSRVPELAQLSPKQRKLVYRCALEAFFSDQPSVLWVCSAIVWGSLLVGALAGWFAAERTGVNGPDWWQTKWFIVTLAGLGAAVIGNLIGNQWMTARLRPYFRRVLEKRSLEIAQIS